jgi:hypothetical protein
MQGYSDKEIGTGNDICLMLSAYEEGIRMNFPKGVREFISTFLAVRKYAYLPLLKESQSKYYTYEKIILNSVQHDDSDDYDHHIAKTVINMRGGSITLYNKHYRKYFQNNSGKYKYNGPRIPEKNIGYIAIRLHLDIARENAKVNNALSTAEQYDATEYDGGEKNEDLLDITEPSWLSEYDGNVDDETIYEVDEGSDEDDEEFDVFT